MTRFKNNEGESDNQRKNNDKISRKERRERLRQQKNLSSQNQNLPIKSELEAKTQQTSDFKRLRPSLRDMLSSDDRENNNNGHQRNGYYAENNHNGKSPISRKRINKKIPSLPIININDHLDNEEFAEEYIKENTQKNQRQNKQKNRPILPILYGMRLLILGIGIGAIAGTVLSTWQPQTKTPNIAKNNQNTSLFNNKPLQGNMNGSNTPVIYENKSILNTTKKIAGLKKPIEDLLKKNSKLNTGIFLIDLDTGAYFDYSGNASFSAASMIKVPILLAFFQDVDAGKIKLNEKLTLEKSIIADGAGTLQYEKIGSKFTTLEVVTKMMRISDNTATNMIIKRLGGKEKLNQRFKSWGLKTTVINNLLADLEGTNLTTPKELVTVMGMINKGEKISSESRDRILDIMQKVKTNTLLPKGLEKNAIIAHKTGDIRSSVGDVGLIDMPSGKRYMVCVIVKRSNNDPKAQELIRQISKTIYQYFKNNG